MTYALVGRLIADFQRFLERAHQEFEEPETDVEMAAMDAAQIIMEASAFVRRVELETWRCVRDTRGRANLARGFRLPSPTGGPSARLFGIDQIYVGVLQASVHVN